MTAQNPSSVQAVTGWRLTTREGRRLTLGVDADTDLLVLGVGHEDAVASTVAYLDRAEGRALAAAARLLSGAETEDYEAIRRDERSRLAQLIEENAELLGSFPPDAPAAIDLVAFLLRLNNPTGAGDGHT